MAFEIPLARWTQVPAGFGPRGGAPAPLDWAGLRARLVATRELRRLIAPAAPVASAAPEQLASGGSFAREVAALLGAPETSGAEPSDVPSRGVNPNDLGNRKAAARMDENDGGTLMSAVRGMQ